METLSAAITLFFIMDPLGNLPMFVSVLDTVAEERRRRVLARELLIALLAALVFLFLGRHLLTLLHLRRAAVSIAGAIVLFLIALRMIFPDLREKPGPGVEGEPFVVPLAIPLVAGPSTFATLVLFASSAPDKMVSWLIALVAAWSGTSAILLASSWVHRRLGARGLIAVERLMGMLLVAIAVNMFLDGLAATLGVGS